MADVIYVDSEAHIVTTGGPDTNVLIPAAVQQVTVIESISIGPQGIQGIQGIQGPAGATVLVYPAGEVLSGHRIVIRDVLGAATVKYASSSNPVHAAKVIGMTRGAALLGADTYIQTDGEIEEPSWNWDLSLPVWLGENGMISQAPPVTGYSLIVASVVTPTRLYIKIREPIFLI